MKMSVLFITCPPPSCCTPTNIKGWLFTACLSRGMLQTTCNSKKPGGLQGHELGQSIIVRIMTENGSFNLVGLPCTGDGLMRAPSIFPATQPSGVSGTPKAWTAAPSILNDWLLHLCYMLWDIMQMWRPLASRPHCSLPVIRPDYAPLAANASSANKFTMTIIIFRPSGTRWGQGGGQV